MVLGRHNREPGAGGCCSPSARGITILCHVGFSILQVV